LLAELPGGDYLGPAVLTHKPWNPESLLWLGFSLMLTLALGAAVAGLYENGSVAQKVANVAVLPVSILVSIIVWFEVNRRVYQSPITLADTFGFNRSKTGRCLLLGLATGFMLVLVAFVLALLSNRLIEVIGKDPGLVSLDIDRDGMISVEEIRNADKALATLDTDGDGKLSSEEIMAKAKLFGGASGLVALDVNKDDKISSGEIENAYKILLTLDQDNDGKLSGGEMTTKATPQELVLFIADLTAKERYGALLFFVLMAVAVAPIAEEFLFRGILYPSIKQIGFPKLAAVGTALLFALIHVNLLTFASLTAVALVLIVLYEKTDNLLAPIIAHAIFNASNVAMIFTATKQLAPTTLENWLGFRYAIESMWVLS